MNLICVMVLARLTVREAVRSRLLLAIAGALLAGLAGLPLLLGGGGTAAGQLEVVLRYSVGYSLVMLSVATLWASCGGVAGEIEDRRLYLVLAKPVHRHELWLGKWLGIMALNTVLLAVSGVMIGAMSGHVVRDGGREGREARERILAAHRAIEPELPLAGGRSRLSEGVAAAVAAGKAPEGATPDALMDRMVREVYRTGLTAAPGGTVTLVYMTGRLAGAGPGLRVAYKIASTRPERLPVAAEWRIEPATRPEAPADSRAPREWVMAVTNYPGVPAEVRIPAAVVAGTHGALRLTYTRKDRDNPALIMLAPDGRGPELLAPAGAFGPNLARGLLLILFRLAFLAAVGLSAGCLLSMPVAVFFSFFMLVTLMMSGYVETVASSGRFYVPHEGPAPEHGLLEPVSMGVFRSLNVVTRPMLELDPAPLLADGRRVSWGLVGRGLALLGGLYTLVAGAVGVLLFARREVG
jgi:hypothetical protein